MPPEASEEEKERKQGVKVGSFHMNGPEGSSPRCRKINPITCNSLSLHKTVDYIWLSLMANPN